MLIAGACWLYILCMSCIHLSAAAQNGYVNTSHSQIFPCRTFFQKYIQEPCRLLITWLWPVYQAQTLTHKQCFKGLRCGEETAARCSYVNGLSHCTHTTRINPNSPTAAAPRKQLCYNHAQNNNACVFSNTSSDTNNSSSSA